MRRFLEAVNLPSCPKYAILTTEPAQKPDRKTGKMPTEEEIARIQHLKSIMNELLKEKGMVKAAETTVHVTSLKGPLEENWQKIVEEFGMTVLGST